MKGFVIFAFVVVIATVNSMMVNLFGGKTLKDSILDCLEKFQNQKFDIVEAGLKTNPDAYEMLKEPFEEIKTNIGDNLRAIHGIVLNEAFWSIKNAAELGQDAWAQHGKEILSGNFDHDHAYKQIVKLLKNTDEFITVNGLAGDLTAKNADVAKN